MNRLKAHPFGVEAFFETSIVLTYAFPKEQLEGLIPDALELDTLDDQYAFVAVAFVKAKSLRPKGFPLFLGRDSMLVGFRVFTNYRSNTGRKFRGLYILKSLTDTFSMSILGNAMTHYNYKKTPIRCTFSGKTHEVQSQEVQFKVVQHKEVILPDGSVFKTWKEARKFAGPMPFTFGVEGREIVIVEGKRTNWNPNPIQVVDEVIPYINELGDGKLVSAFMVENIPYQWGKGMIERW